MSTSDERGRVAQDKTLSHEKQVDMAKTLKEAGKSNKDIAYIMRINESTVRILLTPLIKAEQTLWHPGVYESRTDGDYGKIASSIPKEQLVEIVQMRAEQDGEWTIRNGFVGDNEDTMRKMMAWVSEEKHILQCLEANPSETVDWIARDLANATKWIMGSRD